MFGIGMSEMIIILAVALLVFGPDKLPGIAKSISRGLKDLRRASDDLRHSVNMHIDDEEPRPLPRIKPTAGTPHVGISEPAPNIPGSELAKDLEAAPAHPSESADVVVPRAAEGSVARGSPAPAPTEPASDAPTPPGADDERRGA